MRYAKDVNILQILISVQTVKGPLLSANESRGSLAIQAVTSKRKSEVLEKRTSNVQATVGYNHKGFRGKLFLPRRDGEAQAHEEACEDGVVALPSMEKTRP